jgi:hypothetical protein
MAKDILDETEKKALEKDKSLGNIDEIMLSYINSMDYIETIIESTNPQEVSDSCGKWIAHEDAAQTLMSGIKSAAEIYFKAMGKKDIDYSKEPEDFVSSYINDIGSLPYFSSYYATAVFLSGFMWGLHPTRKGLKLASYIAIAVNSSPTWKCNPDKILEEIEKHEKLGSLMPAIANEFRIKCAEVKAKHRKEPNVLDK